MNHAEVVVIGTAHEAFKEVLDRLRPDQVVVDLVGFLTAEPPERYVGIGW
jgi:hypothetical protein